MFLNHWAVRFFLKLNNNNKGAKYKMAICYWDKTRKRISVVTLVDMSMKSKDEVEKIHDIRVAILRTLEESYSELANAIELVKNLP